MTGPLSVLDQSPISEGSTGGEALARSVDLARHAEALGYTRYWVAEHHGTAMLACTSPEILIAEIAAATTRIRVGSGGVMLPHYSPLKVAEVFSMLSGLHPGRIDLGLGRAAGTDPVTAFALQRDRGHAIVDDFPQQLNELLAFLYDAVPPQHSFAKLGKVLPGLPERPEPWLLGSSPQSGIWAAEAGLPYAFADFISPTGAALTKRYRDDFKPSVIRSEPYVITAVAAICAETDDAAQRLASSARMAFTLFLQGMPIQVPPVDVALRFLAERPGALEAVSAHRRFIVGSPATVLRGIAAVQQEYAADEMMIVTIIHDHAARRRSYELIAEAYR